MQAVWVLAGWFRRDDPPDPPETEDMLRLADGVAEAWLAHVGTAS